MSETFEVRFVRGEASVDDVDEFLAVVRDVREETGTVIQFFDARYVVSRRHLERAIALAERAFDRGENVARDRAVEVLLYAAGRRQIDRALEMGLTEEATSVVAVVYAPPDGDPGDVETAVERVTDLFAEATVVDANGAVDEFDADRVSQFFDVTETELSATAGDLADAVLERVALLDVEK